MNIEEYDKVKSLAYAEYCDYLQQKYGLPKKPYMTNNWNRNPGISRTDEGLVIHHKKEDCAMNLADPKNASKKPYKWQLPENLVYCDLLEHLLLHVLICECRGKKKDSGHRVGVGGAATYLIPQLDDAYNGFIPSKGWRHDCYFKVLGDEEVYKIVLKRFLKKEGWLRISLFFKRHWRKFWRSVRWKGERVKPSDSLS